MGRTGRIFLHHFSNKHKPFWLKLRVLYCDKGFSAPVPSFSCKLLQWEAICLLPSKGFLVFPLRSAWPAAVPSRAVWMQAGYFGLRVSSTQPRRHQALPGTAAQLKALPLRPPPGGRPRWAAASPRPAPPLPPRPRREGREPHGGGAPRVGRWARGLRAAVGPPCGREMAAGGGRGRALCGSSGRAACCGSARPLARVAWGRAFEPSRAGKQTGSDSRCPLVCCLWGGRRAARCAAGSCCRSVPRPERARSPHVSDLLRRVRCLPRQPAPRAAPAWGRGKFTAVPRV